MDWPRSTASASRRENILPAATATKAGFLGLSSAAIESALRNFRLVDPRYRNAVVVFPEPLTADDEELGLGHNRPTDVRPL